MIEIAVTDSIYTHDYCIAKANEALSKSEAARFDAAVAYDKFEQSGRNKWMEEHDELLERSSNWNDIARWWIDIALNL